MSDTVIIPFLSVHIDPQFRSPHVAVIQNPIMNLVVKLCNRQTRKGDHDFPTRSDCGTVATAERFIASLLARAQALDGHLVLRAGTQERILRVGRELGIPAYMARLPLGLIFATLDDKAAICTAFT